MRQSVKWAVVGMLAIALGVSFHASQGWLQLCAGLALFLFGMQCLEGGLKALAGGSMERWLARSTATPLRGLLFGSAATMLLQSSTLVSLLTIAFLGTGLIQLAGAIAVLLGANLGATSGIWLLALAGQDLSLSAGALPLLVFGVLARYTGRRGAAAGQLVVGIAFLLLAIDQIKDGFAAMTALDLAAHATGGTAGVLLFTALGAGLTVVVQSSHATLMLTLAALAAGQLAPEQSLAIAIGSNVGSSVSTAVMGFMGGNRAGQRLAIAHVLFNLTTAVVALLALPWLQAFVLWVTALAGMGGNALIQLALFHTLFNAIGVALFWPGQQALARLLQRWLPDRRLPDTLVGQLAAGPALPATPHLPEAALHSAEGATQALSQTLRQLGRLSVEVIGQALYCPPDELDAPRRDSPALRERVARNDMDSDALYRQLVKPVWAGMLHFISRFDGELDPAQRLLWRDGQEAASQLVKAVKDAHALQTNLRRQLHPDAAQPAAAQAWLTLRMALLEALAGLRAASRSCDDPRIWREQLAAVSARLEAFGQSYGQTLFAAVRAGDIDSVQLASLINDLGYARRIVRHLQQVLLMGDGHSQGLPWRDLFDDSSELPPAPAAAAPARVCTSAGLDDGRAGQDGRDRPQAGP